MADYQVHLDQALHNQKTAQKLANDPPHHDWGITAAFYSAIHFFECWLYGESEKHTETSIPTNAKGEWLYSPHGWREKLVSQKMSKQAFKAFRKLRDSSETSRYLTLRISGRSSSLTGTASRYFNPASAQKVVNGELPQFYNELNIPLRHLIYSLELGSQMGVSAPLVTKKILTTFRDRNHFLQTSEKDFLALLGTPNGPALVAILKAKGHSILP